VATVANNPEYSPEDVDRALEALIAHAGNAKAACEYLELSGLRAPHSGTLSKWAKTTHFERYEELREKFSPQREGQLANHYLDASIIAAEAAMEAVTQAKKRLEAGDDTDPARTASNLASMAQRLTDKRLALQGRPQRITENRDASQILRGLIAKHPQVFGLSEPPAELEEGGNDGQA
jgi:hypothetical protein